MRDEGNVFYVFKRPTVVYDEVVNHFLTTSWPYSAAHLEQTPELYRGNQTTGLPFCTSDSNALYARFKHNSAITGDYTF